MAIAINYSERSGGMESGSNDKTSNEIDRAHVECVIDIWTSRELNASCRKETLDEKEA